MGNDLRSDLHRLLAQGGEAPLLDPFRQDQGAQEIGEIIGQGVQLEAHAVAPEPGALHAVPDRMLISAPPRSAPQSLTIPS